MQKSAHPGARDSQFVHPRGSTIQCMVDTAMHRNHAHMTEFCNTHGIVPVPKSFRYCPYEVLVIVFNKMLETGMCKDTVIGAIRISTLAFGDRLRCLEVQEQVRPRRLPQTNSFPSMSLANPPRSAKSTRKMEWKTLRTKPVHSKIARLSRPSMSLANPPKFCKKHEEDGMEDVINKPVFFAFKVPSLWRSIMPPCWQKLIST